LLLVVVAVVADLRAGAGHLQSQQLTSVDHGQPRNGCGVDRETAPVATTFSDLCQEHAQMNEALTKIKEEKKE
jgi:hypothetical protein